MPTPSSIVASHEEFLRLQSALAESPPVYRDAIEPPQPAALHVRSSRREAGQDGGGRAEDMVPRRQAAPQPNGCRGLTSGRAGEVLTSLREAVSSDHGQAFFASLSW